MNWNGPTDIALYLTSGMALGALYFLLLAWTVRLHASKAAATRIISFYFVRFAVAISTFWIIAQQGASPLLLALLGFLFARVATQCWMRLV